MRIVRLVALLGSLMLLVATTVSLLNRRAENRGDQIARVEAAADLVSVAVRANVEAGRTAVEVAVQGSADPSRRAAIVRELAESLVGGEACVIANERVCSGPDLSALSRFDDLAEAAADSPQAIAAVDPASGTVLFVERDAMNGDTVTVVVQAPIDSLLRQATRTMATSRNVGLSIEALSRSSGDSRQPAALIDGRRVVGATLGDPFADGSLSVRTSIEGRVGLAGGNPVRYGAQLAAGTILLAFAAWTYLRERRKLEQRASTDELTGLVNRREFERIASVELEHAQRLGLGMCLMVIDLNGFKQVNDTLGHQFGDLVLKASAERLTDAVRDTDVVGRWGGDEFVIMLPSLEDRSAVRDSAERISSTLGGSPVVGSTVMTASIGAAIFPRHGTTLDALMRAADVAMYGAKTTGVGHRIADTIAAQQDLIGADINGGSGFDGVVQTDDYAGPDRRRSPVPPPPPQHVLSRNEGSADPVSPHDASTSTTGSTPPNGPITPDAPSPARDDEAVYERVEPVGSDPS